MDKIEQKRYNYLFLKGLLMGAFDIVPGISGGTIALITGIYPNLVNALCQINSTFFISLAKLQIRKALQLIDLRFLLTLGSGILLALLSFARIINHCMSSYPIMTWSIFFGLLLGSIINLGIQYNPLKSFTSLTLFILGIIGAYGLIGLIPLETPNDLPYLFFYGMMGSIAMILPGISGSFVMLIIGQYFYLTEALKNPLESQNFILLMVFSCGAFTGLISFSKVLNYLISKFNHQTMAILIGFMIGSMRKVWPFKFDLDGQSYNIWPEININSISALTLIFLCVMLVLIFERFVRNQSLT